MSSPLAGVPEELAGRQAGPGAPSPVLPNGPGYPRIVQAWLWLKKPTWFLDRCSRTYGDVFTMRLPMGINMVHIARPELVKAVFGGDNDVLRAGEATGPGMRSTRRWPRRYGSGVTHPTSGSAATSCPSCCSPATTRAGP